MNQAPNLGSLLCIPKFESQRKNHEVKNCRKNCVGCPYLLKTSLYQFKRVNKTFLLKNFFNCESSSLICVVICQGCKEEHMGKTDCLANKYLQTTYNAAAISTIGSWRTVRYFWRREFSYVFFFSRFFKKILLGLFHR